MIYLFISANSFKHRNISDFFRAGCCCKVSESDWNRSQIKNYYIGSESKISHSSSL